MSTAGEISGRNGPRRYKPGDLDFFIEPRWAVDLLLDAEPIIGPAWDPACGSGTIPKAIVDRGHVCHASDIADRGQGAVHDFLAEPPSWAAGVATIVTNPPYVLARRFIEQGLALASHKVCALVQAKFPYSQGRYPLFTQHPPARIYFLSSRPSMPPGEKLLAGTVKAQGGKLDYCWMVWSREHKGATQAHWLRRPREAQAARAT